MVRWDSYWRVAWSLDAAVGWHVFWQSRTRNTIFVIAIILLVVLLIRSQKTDEGTNCGVAVCIDSYAGMKPVLPQLVMITMCCMLCPASSCSLEWWFGFFWDRAWIFGKLCSCLCWVFVMVNVPWLEFRHFSSLQSCNLGADAIASSLSKEQLPQCGSAFWNQDYYGQNYRYFLDTIPGKEPLNPDHDDFSVAKTLIIINRRRYFWGRKPVPPIFWNFILLWSDREADDYSSQWTADIHLD